MDSSERKRLHIIRKAIEGTIKQRKAAELLGLSVRQVRRISKAIRIRGDSEVIHKLRGKSSNRRIEEDLRTKILDLYMKRYEGFGPKFATEKLRQEKAISISAETLRLWLKQENISYPARRARPHRHWRKRKDHRGEMIQLDGSHHDWLEGRGPWLVLMAYIDDATNEVFARFYDSEDNFSGLDSFMRYIRKKGLPCSVYCDRHAVYKTQRRGLTIDEQLEGLDEAMTNFQRALKELAVELIYAYSPQAKGRVERLFRTLQDRLVKELRLAKISTKTEANRFLQTYLPSFNKKYCVGAENQRDLHRPLPPHTDLRRVLCIKEMRTVKNDFTIQYAGHFYQIEEKTKAKQITVEIWLDGSMHVSFEGKELRYKQIHPPIRKEIPEGPGKSHRINRVQPLPKDSPWRAFMINPPKSL